MDTKVTFTKEVLCEELTNSIVNYGDFSWVKHMFVNRFYTSNPKLMTSENGMLNQSFRLAAIEFQACFKEEDYEGVVMWIERPWRLKWVYDNRKLIKRNAGVERFYEIVADVYSDTENACQFKNEAIKLFYYAKQPLFMMDSNEKEGFVQLPNELKIYRGVCLKEKDNKHDFLGCSWTLDYEKAKWFAERRGFKNDEYPLVYSLTVSKQDVLSYFTRRNESEIVIDFNKIDLDELEFIYPNTLNIQASA